MGQSCGSKSILMEPRAIVSLCALSIALIRPLCVLFCFCFLVPSFLTGLRATPLTPCPRSSLLLHSPGPALASLCGAGA